MAFKIPKQYRLFGPRHMKLEGFAGELQEAFKLKPATAWNLAKVMRAARKGNDNEVARESVGYEDAPAAALDLVNKVIRGFGVEAVRGEGYEVDRYYYDCIALYVNTGDTYNVTVLYDTERNKFYVTSWGEWYEEWQAGHPDYVPCQDCGRVGSRHSSNCQYGEDG